MTHRLNGSCYGDRFGRLTLHLVAGGEESHTHVSNAGKLVKLLSLVRVDEMLYFRHLKLSHSEQPRPGGYLVPKRLPCLEYGQPNTVEWGRWNGTETDQFEQLRKVVFRC